jgi:protein SCO1
MSNETLTDSSPAPAASKRSTFRRIWLISGLVLWALVIAALWALGVLRQKQQTTKDADAPPALVLSEDANPSATPTQQLTIPAPPWNPAGVEDFTFTERGGKKVTKADLLGHPWLISFIFTRCAGPCPKVSIQMSELQSLLKGSDVRLVTLTVDPDFDTTSVLSRYAETYRADPKRWLYLTGDKRKTYELINNSFLMPVKEYIGKDREPGYEVMHSTNILLVNAKGVVVGKYNAVDAEDISRLRHDLKPYLHRSGARDGDPSEPKSALPLAESKQNLPHPPKGDRPVSPARPAAKQPKDTPAGGAH